MASAGKRVDVHLDPQREYQSIDGFGVNLNTKYWTGSGERLRPALDLLLSDGATLADYDAFAEMQASLADWACRREGINFQWFGPLNESDLGSPEGPKVTPQEYVKVCEVLDEKLTDRGLDDIRLIVPEAAHFTPAYLRELVKSTRLTDRIHAFSMHD